MSIAKRRSGLSAQRLRALITYDQATGEFRWGRRGQREGTWCNVDRHAGSVSKQTGYRAIRVDGVLYQAHRLAWLYVHGQWPAGDVDHINGDRLDNRLANLRVVDAAINRQNVRVARSDSQARLLGAHFDKRRGVFFSQIKTHGRVKYLGAHASAEAAHEAYLLAKRALHAGCTI